MCSDTFFNQRLKFYEPFLKQSSNAFSKEICSTLTKKKKSIHSKFLYDQKGSELFEKICELPEYYLTKTEANLLRQIDLQLSTHFNTNYCLIELGSGTSLKTKILIEMFLRKQTCLDYFPIDISKILKTSARELCAHYKRLKITGIIADYEEGLHFIQNYTKMKKLILFLGSSLGNFSPREQKLFLQKIYSFMQQGDRLLIGLDLVKDIHVLERAYNDSQGITAEFNLNVFRRINSELGGNFDLTKFSHFTYYNKKKKRIESYLRSLEKQRCMIHSENQWVDFEKGELVHTENSHKFTLSDIKKLFNTIGYQINEIWRDEKNPYSLALVSKK